jgi:hypothetical protein
MKRLNRQARAYLLAVVQEMPRKSRRCVRSGCAHSPDPEVCAWCDGDLCMVHCEDWYFNMK